MYFREEVALQHELQFDGLCLTRWRQRFGKQDLEDIFVEVVES